MIPVSKSPQAKKVTSGFSYLIASNTIVTLVGALCSILLARLLDPASFGILVLLALFLPSLVGIFGDLGMTYATTHFLSAYLAEGKKIQAREVIEVALTWGVAVGLLLSIGYLVFSNLFMKYTIKITQTIQFAPFVALLIFFSIVTSFLLAILQGFQKLDYMAAVNVCEVIVRAPLAPALVLAGLGIMGGLSGFLVASLCMLVLAFTFLNRCFKAELSEVKVRSNTFNVFRNLLSVGFPFAISEMLISISSNLSPFLIASLASLSEVGYYNVALAFIGPSGIFLAATGSALFPAFSSLDALCDENTIRKFYENATVYASFFLIPSAFIIALLARPLIEVIFSTTYLPSTSVLTILSIEIALLGIGASVYPLLMGVKKTKEIAVISFVSTSVSIIGCLIFIPGFGASGAAIALVTSSAVYFFLGHYYIARFLKTRLKLRLLARIITTSFLMTVVISPITFVISNNILKIAISITTGGFLYLLFSLIAKSITIIDLQNIDILFRDSILYKPMKPFLMLALKIALWFERVRP
jgi:O-antigen/teichoic acid export membrane protein